MGSSFLTVFRDNVKNKDPCAVPHFAYGFALTNRCHKEELSQRVSSWTQSVAVGSGSFVENIKKQQLKALAIGRRIVSTIDGWELREEASSYSHNPFFEGQKVDIDHENTYPWEKIVTISMC